MTRQRATDATGKAEALRLAEEHGAAEAAKRTGVPAATIRSWRHRSGEAGPPKGVDPQTWAERKRAGAEEAWAAAQEALAQVRSLLVAGKTADAQRAFYAMDLASTWPPRWPSVSCCSSRSQTVASAERSGGLDGCCSSSPVCAYDTPSWRPSTAPR